MMRRAQHVKRAGMAEYINFASISMYGSKVSDVQERFICYGEKHCDATKTYYLVKICKYPANNRKEHFCTYHVHLFIQTAAYFEKKLRVKSHKKV